MYVYTNIYIVNQCENIPPSQRAAPSWHPAPKPGLQPLAMWSMTSSVSGQESEWHVALAKTDGASNDK